MNHKNILNSQKFPTKSISNFFYPFFLILLIIQLTSIKCDSSELESLAEKISTNLQGFAWKKVKGFNYTNYYQTLIKSTYPESDIQPEQFKLIIHNIIPIIQVNKAVSPGYVIIDTETEQSITFNKFRL